MDTWTVLLMVVIGVIAASQLMQHIGDWILRPYVFWPVEGLLVLAVAFVLVARFGENPQLDWTIKAFLTLFLAWRLLQNHLIRQRTRQRRAAQEWERRERQRELAAAEQEEAAPDTAEPSDGTP